MSKLKWFLILWVSLAAASFAQKEIQGHEFTLSSTVETALSRNPLGKASQINVQRAGFDVLKAKAIKYLPTMTFGLTTGLVPEARGDVFSSPDKMDDINGLGPFYRTSLEIVQPLLTFGKTSTAVKASEQAVLLLQSQHNLVEEKISLEAIKAYWRVSAAQSAEDLAQDLRESYEELLTKVQEKLNNEDSEVNYTDLLEVKTLYYSIEESFQRGIEKKEISTKAFITVLDLDPKSVITISPAAAPVIMDQGQKLDPLISLAERYRSDLDALNTSLNLIQVKIDLAMRQRYPSIFLVAGLGFAHAANRADQTNPFVVDNFNYRRVHAALGLRWNPNFLLHNIEIKKAESEYQLNLEKLRAEKAKIVLEVNRTFQAVKTNHALWVASQKSLKSAKTWLRVAYENWELGIGEVRKLLRAYQAYYRLNAVEIERNFGYNISLAELAYSLGETGFYLAWIENGKVNF